MMRSSCYECGGAFDLTNTKCLMFNGNCYHLKCLCCAGCGKSFRSQCLNIAGQPYCDRCGRKAFVLFYKQRRLNKNSSAPALLRSAKKTQTTPKTNQVKLSHGKSSNVSSFKSSQPSYSKPSTPSYNKPSTPSYNKPSTPSYNKPSTPSYNKPSTPSYNTPSTPSYNKPASIQNKKTAYLSNTGEKGSSGYRKPGSNTPPKQNVQKYANFWEKKDSMAKEEKSYRKTSSKEEPTPKTLGPVKASNNWVPRSRTFASPVPSFNGNTAKGNDNCNQPSWMALAKQKSDRRYKNPVVSYKTPTTSKPVVKESPVTEEDIEDHHEEPHIVEGNVEEGTVEIEDASPQQDYEIEMEPEEEGMGEEEGTGEEEGEEGPSNMTEEDVGDWIEIYLGLPQYVHLFQENNIDGQVLISLTNGDLEDLGIKSFGHRLKIIKAIEQLSKKVAGSSKEESDPKEDKTRAKPSTTDKVREASESLSASAPSIVTSSYPSQKKSTTSYRKPENSSYRKPLRFQGPSVPKTNEVSWLEKAQKTRAAHQERDWTKRQNPKRMSSFVGSRNTMSVEQFPTYSNNDLSPADEKELKRLSVKLQPVNFK